MFDQMEKEMDTLICKNSYGQTLSNELCAASESKNITLGQHFDQKEVGDDGAISRQVVEKGSKKKRGKNAGSVKAGVSEDDPDTQENFTGKAKKNARKSKGTGSSDVPDTKVSAKKGLDKGKDDSVDIPSEEWIMERILTLAPDLEDVGG